MSLSRFVVNSFLSSRVSPLFHPVLSQLTRCFHKILRGKQLASSRGSLPPSPSISLLSFPPSLPPSLPPPLSLSPLLSLLPPFSVSLPFTGRHILLCRHLPLMSYYLGVVVLSFLLFSPRLFLFVCLSVSSCCLYVLFVCLCAWFSFGVCIWACGQNTTNHRKSEVSPSPSPPLSLSLSLHLPLPLFPPLSAYLPPSHSVFLSVSAAFFLDFIRWTQRGVCVCVWGGGGGGGARARIFCTATESLYQSTDIRDWYTRTSSMRHWNDKTTPPPSRKLTAGGFILGATERCCLHLRDTETVLQSMAYTATTTWLYS